MLDQAAPFDVDRLISLRRVSSVAPSPDGTWLAVAASRLSGDGSKYVSDLWKVSLTDSEAAPVQLTRGVVASAILARSTRIRRRKYDDRTCP